jgi:hypothetical protein
MVSHMQASMVVGASIYGLKYYEQNHDLVIIIE